MKTAGIREFKARLSDYLRAAEKGERVIIMKRGRPAFELRTCGPSSNEETERLAIQQMVDELDADAAQHGPLLQTPELALRALDEDRDDQFDELLGRDRNNSMGSTR